MIKFKYIIIILFCSDCRLDNSDKVLKRIQKHTSEAFSLFSGTGTEGKEAGSEDSFMMMRFTDNKREGERLAKIIRKEFKQQSVLLSIRENENAYLFSK